MLVSPAHRVLFVHVQKTGGVTVEDLFEAHVPDVIVSSQRHPTYQQILDRHPEYADFWSFGFVRNPWARMVSWHTMINGWKSAKERSGKPLDSGSHAKNRFWHRVAEFESFEEFVLTGTIEFERMRLPQLDFLTANGRQVDYIGKTESLAADLTVVMEKVGIGYQPVGHRNASRHGSYRDYYGEETRTRIAELFAKDIETFGYEF